MVVLLHLGQSAKLMPSLRINTSAHDDFWDPSMTGSETSCERGHADPLELPRIRSVLERWSSTPPPGGL